MSCGDKFWATSPKDLFCTYEVVPESSMSMPEKLVLIVFEIKYAFLFLLLGLVIIVFVYRLSSKEKFSHSKQMSNSTYQHTDVGTVYNTFKPRYEPSEAKITYNTLEKLSVLKREPNAATYCDVVTPLKCIQSENSITANQKLAGCANPKTLIAPPIVPPSHAFEYWNSTSLNVPSGINEETNEDVYRSGYFPSFSSKIATPSSQHQSFPTLVRNGGNPYAPDINVQRVPQNQQLPRIRENFSKPEEKEDFVERRNPRNSYTVSQCDRSDSYDQIDRGCGYNESNIKYGLPVNYKAGNCQMNKKMKGYNENVFTQTIQPGVYTTSQVTEPINSNIGISFAQEFEPTVKSTFNGSTEYSQYNPNDFNQIYEAVPGSFCDNRNNTYDPRFTGNGPSDRSYVESVTGQPRFYYEDVNSVNRPNYLSRSNVDFIPSLPYEYDAPSDTRKMVEDEWTKNSINFRTDLQEQLMRKMNVGKWQQRVAPINTGGQRMLGGSRIC
jgi:hypothetical protein